MFHHGEDSIENLFSVHDAGGVNVVVSATVVAAGDEKVPELEDLVVEVARVVLAAAEAEVELLVCCEAAVVDMVAIPRRYLIDRLSVSQAKCGVLDRHLSAEQAAQTKCGPARQDQGRTLRAQAAYGGTLGPKRWIVEPQCAGRILRRCVLTSRSGRRSTIVYLTTRGAWRSCTFRGPDGPEFFVPNGLNSSAKEAPDGFCAAPTGSTVRVPELSIAEGMTGQDHQAS